MRWGTLVALVVLAACKRAPDSSATAVDGGALPVVEAGPVVVPAVVAARCQAASGGAAVASPQELEVGDGIAFGDGYAVGMVHRTAAGRVAAVALVDRDVATARVIDLGATLGDAPPPRLVRRGKDLLVAGYALPKANATVLHTRELVLQTIGAGGDVKPLATVAQQHDDSLALDLGPGLVAWDEASTGAAPRGVVRVAEIAADHAGPPRDASPADSDAEMPRVVPDGAGYFVLWMARRPEPAGTVDAAALLEAVGEARAFSWLEMVTVDAAGAPTGPVRRLTPASGHVSAYDVLALPGDGKPTLLVVARDDGEAVDGSGGALLRVRVREDAADLPLAFPGDGLGRGAPQLIEAPRPSFAWLSWIGPHEELRMLPLDGMGAPVAPPSAEPLLDEALPLTMLQGERGGREQGDAQRMLVAFPGEAARQLAVVTCAR